MKPITCLLIEDEKLSRDELRYLLEPYDYIHILGEADSGTEGYAMIKALKPDLIFLDISMPGMSGVDLAAKLDYLANRPKIVFTTAHQDYAVKAFELDALDYLLKPYDDRRFHATMERIRQYFSDLKATEKDTHPMSLSGQVKRIAVQRDDKTLLLDLQQVVYCCAENDKIYIHTHQAIYDVGGTLLDVIERAHLFRIHRSYAVNLQHIHELYPWFNGTYQICMNDAVKTKLTVSRSYVKTLKSALRL